MHHPESPVELEVEPLAAKVGRVNVQNKPGSLCQGSFPKLPLSFLILKLVIHSLARGMVFFLLGGGRAVVLEQDLSLDLSSLSLSLLLLVKRSGVLRMDWCVLLNS